MRAIAVIATTVFNLSTFIKFVVGSMFSICRKVQPRDPFFSIRIAVWALALKAFGFNLRIDLARYRKIKSLLEAKAIPRRSDCCRAGSKVEWPQRRLAICTRHAGSAKPIVLPKGCILH